MKKLTHVRTWWKGHLNPDSNLCLARTAQCNDQCSDLHSLKPSRSRYFAESWSGSSLLRNKDLVRIRIQTKNYYDKICKQIHNCKFFYKMPSYTCMSSETPTKDVQTLQTWNFLIFTLFFRGGGGGKILACQIRWPNCIRIRNTGKDDRCGYLSLEVAEDEVPEAVLPVLHLDELVQMTAEGDQDQHHCHTTKEAHPA